MEENEDMKRKLYGAIAAIGILTCMCITPVYAKENMIPDYEIKFLIDSDQVLNKNYELKSKYRDEFQTGKKYNKVGVEYIETPNFDFSSMGWTNRIRIKEDANNFELTYKKRYAIENGDIDAALTKANQEGFDISDTNYAAQVDWGYNKMTLSLGNNKTVSNKGYESLELPGKKDAIKILKDHMPGKELNWNIKNWGDTCISDGKKCGPVYYLKYKGEIDGISVDIEVWPVENQSSEITEYITELSFKEDTYDEAVINRKIVQDVLEKDSILIHEDSLKTQKILNAYLQ